MQQAPSSRWHTRACNGSHVTKGVAASLLRLQSTERGEGMLYIISIISVMDSDKFKIQNELCTVKVYAFNGVSNTIKADL